MTIALAVPNHVHLSLSREFLRWRPGKGFHMSEPIPSRFLEMFLRLADGSPTDVLSFAKKRGVLGLCPHGRPAGHDDKCSYGNLGGFDQAFEGDLKSDGSLLPELLGTERPRVFESIQAWQRLASQAAAILNLVVDLQAGNYTRPNDWSALCPDESHLLPGFVTPPGVASKGGLAKDVMDEDFMIPCPWERAMRDRPIGVKREAVGAIVTSWLDDAKIRPAVFWTEGEAPDIVLVTGETGEIKRQALAIFSRPGEANAVPIRTRLGLDTFSVLALQLAAAVTSPNGVWRCDGCSKPYQPLRRPRRDMKHHYCPECADGDRVSKRYSAQQSRARSKITASSVGL